MTNPLSNINQAVQAYNQAARNDASAVAGTERSELQDDFASLVKGAIHEARRIGERSERLSLNAIQDRADLTQVITAVKEAEMTLQSMVNVRDKVLESYQRILRMPI